MSQTFKNLLTGAIVMTILFIAWGVESLQFNRPGLFARLCLWAIGIAFAVLLALLTMHFAHAREPGGRRYLVFAVQYNGKVWRNTADAIALSASECQRYAKSYGDGVTARCYRRLPR